MVLNRFRFIFLLNAKGRILQMIIKQIFNKNVLLNDIPQYDAVKLTYALLIQIFKREEALEWTCTMGTAVSD